MGKFTPMFSIVVPVYNVEKYLEECVESVLNQSYTDYELILVDDGSSDSSGKICDKYHILYPSSIKVFHKQNEGLLLTRVYGIEKATGRFIISLDSDDMLRNDALEVIERTIVNHSSDLILFCASKKKDYSERWNKLPLKSNEVICPDKLYELVCRGTYLNNMALKVFKREYYGGRELLSKYSGVKNGEDCIQSLFIIDKAKFPVFLDEALYYYRDNGNSITNTFQESYFNSVSTVGYKLREYADKWDNGEGKFVFLVYQRNLLTCSRAIKEIIKRCDARKLRHEQFEMICHSDFFVSSVKAGEVNCLPWTDKILLKICDLQKYYLFDLLKILLR